MARTRSVKPAFFQNEELAECDIGARLLFIGLWTLADCRGILEWRPKRIKAQLFPYDGISLAKVEGWVQSLEQRDFVRRYTENGRNCLLISNFQKHQHVHPKEKPSDIPGPTETSPVFPGPVSEKPEPTRPLTSYLIPSTLGCSEQGSEQTEPLEHVPTSEGTQYAVTADQVDAWRDAYPGIDVLQEIKRAKAWLVANPKKAKTSRGMSRFLNSWMDRAQNRRGGKTDSGEWAAR